MSGGQPCKNGVRPEHIGAKSVLSSTWCTADAELSELTSRGRSPSTGGFGCRGRGSYPQRRWRVSADLGQLGRRSGQCGGGDRGIRGWDSDRCCLQRYPHARHYGWARSCALDLSPSPWYPRDAHFRQCRCHPCHGGRRAFLSETLPHGGSGPSHPLVACRGSDMSELLNRCTVFAKTCRARGTRPPTTPFSADPYRPDCRGCTVGANHPTLYPPHEATSAD